MPRKPTGRKAQGLRWGEGHVHRRGDKWQARWDEEQPDGSTRSRAKSFDTEDAAIEHLRQVSRDKREQRYVARTHLTVDALVSRHLERGKRRWSSNTLATYANTAANHIAPHIGARNAHDLTPADVTAWVATLEAGRLSASVIENALHIVSGAYKAAIVARDVATNPTEGVRTPPRPKREMLTWTAAEARIVLADPKATPQMRALYSLSLATGMRPGELRALQWRDVDLDRGTVQVRRSMSRDAQFRAIIGEGTKTMGSRRSVAIPATTVRALTAHRADQDRRRAETPAWEDLGLVFDNGAGRWWSQQSWKREHDRMCARLGITQIRLHDIRHTAATLMLERNVHPKVVADMLGHSSVTMTLDRYSHPSDQLHRSAVEAVEAHLQTTTPTSRTPRKRPIPRRKPRANPRTPAKSTKSP